MQITEVKPQPTWANAATERVFDVDTGRTNDAGDLVVLTVCVTIRRQDQAAEHISARADARVVDADGATEAVGGTPVEAPPKTYTIVPRPDESGAATVDRVRARATTEAIERAINHREALVAWARLPAS